MDEQLWDAVDGYLAGLLVEPTVVGSRRLTEALAPEPQLSATALQTVGGKGHDGFALAVVDA